MAFTEDGLRAKLSSLNETQDSISTVGQWILFHRRHADRIAQLWMQRVKESTPSKRLNLIYLANEITQTSKIRKKEEFLRAYEPIIAESTAAAYKGSPPEIQGKIRRVVEVWRQRVIFQTAIQTQIEQAIDEIDKTRSSRKPALGGSLFSSSSIPPELTPVAPLAISLQKADISTKPALATANQEYEKLTDPKNPIPSPPMHAAALAALVKKLNIAEGAVAESMKARQALITGLEKLLETNKATLATEEAQKISLVVRKKAIESRKVEIEDAILKGMSAAETNRISAAPLAVPAGVRSGGTSDALYERPKMEELTPPPMESFTPVGSPRADPVDDGFFPKPASNPVQPVVVSAPPGISAISATETAIAAAPGADLLSSLTRARADDGANGDAYGPSTHKKRKMSRSVAEDEFAAFAGDGDIDGIDADVGGLI
ncbi:DUF618-domain-containing protein [Pleomassaria siparia CBS 279.74]|uniref:DUF618-domain-containing protein n=1 Tax=Pleomassaria siparia CBS 279.74 TaxID=1314801 RepID=A0A6G1KRI2_9PLEO|nr:DUF618-domain-containing protein [Pleomassaria siparia CBS 279.74]